MNIGSVKPSDVGQLLGSVACLNFDAKIGFRPVASSNERSPKFEIAALNVARRWVRIGALWEKEASQTGEVYLTGHLDDPSLPSKLYVAAFRQDDGSYSIVWNRSNPQAGGVGGQAVGSRSFDEGDGVGPDFERVEAPAADVAGPTRGRRRAVAPEREPAEDPFA